MPAKMRLLPASFAASVNLLNDRSTPAQVAVKPTWSEPKNAARDSAAARLCEECNDTYD
jgi:hypothetical protein